MIVMTTVPLVHGSLPLQQFILFGFFKPNHTGHNINLLLEALGCDSGLG